MRLPLFVELCAGLASMSLMLQHGKHCKPPVSRMGNKHGYGLAILRVMGLRPGQRAEQYLWCEPDAGCRALLHAYTDPALMREAADIIRGWKDEDPRALWKRLRAEGPIRDFGARESARWTLRQGWTNGGNPVGQGGRFGGEIIESPTGTHYPLTAAKLTVRLDSLAQASELARYLQVSASNRLVNIDSTTMQNSGKGGTTFGGEEFATGAGKVAEAAREVSRQVVVSRWAFSQRPAWPDNPGYGGPGSKCGDFKGRDESLGCERTADRMHPLGLPAAIVPDAREIRPEDVAEWMTRADAAREVARHVLGGVWSYRQSEPASGFVGPGQRRQDTTATATATATARVVQDGGLPATIVPDARETTPPTLPPGCVAYMDGPYEGTTGYGHAFPRAEQVKAIRRWAEAGAACYVSEAEPIPELVADGWHTVEITSTRVGQKRTFSKQKREWLTMNRPPAWVPPVQESLF